MSPAPKKPFRTRSGRADPYSAALRHEFFLAVDEVAPELAREMVEVLGPVFRQLAEETTQSNLRDFAWVAREQHEFIQAWLEWSEPRGLHHDSWILDHVLALLPGFLAGPDIPPAFGSAPPLTVSVVPGHQITPPNAYRPDLETRAEYLERVNKYADLVEGVARDIGWETAPNKHYLKLHLRWLARFQVKGESVESLAPRGKPSRRNIERALKDAAELLGLTRRTLRRP